MISLHTGQLSSTQCKIELEEYKDLLNKHSEIDETTLQNFFIQRPQLILLMRRVVGIDAPRKYNNELPIINKYRADFVVADQTQSTFSFIEFEDAKNNSIFNKNINKKTSTYPWANRFEHGYSQVVDWYIHLASNIQTQNMKSEFGSFSIKYFGALIIGRNSSLQHGDCRERFDHRISKSLIDSKHITCYTFDELYDAMEDQYAILSSFGT